MRSATRHDAVAGNPLRCRAEVRAAMRHEHVEFGERTRIEKQIQAFAGRRLAALVLRIDAVFAAADSARPRACASVLHGDRGPRASPRGVGGGGPRNGVSRGVSGVGESSTTRRPSPSDARTRCGSRRRRRARPRRSAEGPPALNAARSRSTACGFETRAVKLRAALLDETWPRANRGTSAP
jgi:hypothetical protein